MPMGERENLGRRGAGVDSGGVANKVCDKMELPEGSCTITTNVNTTERCLDHSRRRCESKAAIRSIRETRRRLHIKMSG